MSEERRDLSKIDRRAMPARRQAGERRLPENIHELIARAETEIDIATRLLDVAVIARRMGVSGTTIRNWIIDGRLLAIRTPTGRYRIPVSELARLIKTQVSQASQP